LQILWNFANIVFSSQPATIEKLITEYNEKELDLRELDFGDADREVGADGNNGNCYLGFQPVLYTRRR
jgi:hypothetical protein